MKATEANFLKILEGRKQFIIPIFQRTYSWKQEQCEQLWNDIIRVATNSAVPAHFIGSIVYIERGIFQAVGVTQLLVIDGQQRLTTLMLLLAAIGEAIQKGTEQATMTQRKIGNLYLFNTEDDGENHYKLILTKSDKETLTRKLEGLPLPENVSARIVENYEFFSRQIAKKKVTLDQLLDGIAKLVVVDVSLDRSHDNPQLIFESLNSTGLDLSQADLIRNYVLMGLEPKEQEQLYNAYWFPMEQRFGHAEYSSEFDRFMRDYLTLKSQSGVIPNINQVYSAFKLHIQSLGKISMADVVADIYHYSKYFVNLAFEKEPVADLKDIFNDINTLKVDVAYPFLIEIYDDYENKKLSRDEFVAILKLVESYVFRRAICGIPTNSLNKTFATLTRGKRFDKANYLQSVQTALVNMSSYRRFPDDEEFQREIKVKDVYNFRSRNYLLRKLENAQHPKEPVIVENLTIEHILPQNPNLSPEWQEELGPNWKQVQSQYLHTIGNLTLTGYNEKYSDKPFVEKRDTSNGFRQSPIGLNAFLKDLEHWGVQEIQQRAQTLGAQAVGIWQRPTPPAGVVIDSALDDDEEEKDKEKVLGERFKDERWDLFQQVRKQILNLDSSVSEHIKKMYVAYKTATNFVDVLPSKKGLKLYLNMPFDELKDPTGLGIDMTGKDHWGNGDIKVYFTATTAIEVVMNLIRQSLDYNRENGTE